MSAGFDSIVLCKNLTQEKCKNLGLPKDFVAELKQVAEAQIQINDYKKTQYSSQVNKVFKKKVEDEPPKQLDVKIVDKK